MIASSLMYFIAGTLSKLEEICGQVGVSRGIIMADGRSDAFLGR
jgi:hypothetical protein